MVPRTLMGPEHEAFRASVKRFFVVEVLPHQEAWEDQGYVDRSIWNRAGELGLLCITLPEEYGGSGGDALFNAVLLEEQAYAGANGMNIQAHDIVASYILHFGSDEQKRTLLPKMAAGEIVGAIGMTEPSGGSDLQAIKTSAVKDGDDYVINGAKTFISNGYLCDVVAVVCKTGKGGAKDMTVILVEAGRDGFVKGKPLKKIGLKAQDTAELFFDDTRVPQANLLGGEGQGFQMVMKELAFERLMVAVTSIASAQAALDMTIAYTRERKVFGNPVITMQNTRFKLAEMKTQISIGQVYVDRCLELYLNHQLTSETAAGAKYWASDLLGRVVDDCVQLHGGYGCMLEYPIAHAFVDARANRIYVGTNEVMKEIVARSL